MHKQAMWPPVVAGVLLVVLLVAASWAHDPAWWNAHWQLALGVLGIIVNLCGIGLTLWAFRREHLARGLGSEVGLGDRVDVSLWREIAADDDVEASVAKLRQNLEILQGWLGRAEADLTRIVAGMHKGVEIRLATLDERLAARGAADAAITSGAIRLQMWGLVIASFGVLLTAAATLF